MSFRINRDNPDHIHWYYCIDMPLYESQVDRLQQHLDAALTQDIRQALLEVWHDSYGSFRLTFSRELLEEVEIDADDELADLLTECIGDSEIVECLAHANYVTNDDPYSGIESDLPMAMASYVSVMRAASYDVDLDSLQEVFGDDSDFTDEAATLALA